MRSPGPGVAEVLAALPTATAGDPPRIDLPPAAWVPSLSALAAAGASYLDFLTAVDRPMVDDGIIEIVAHVVEPGTWWHVLVATRCPRQAAALGTVTSAYPGAAWHERETAEMFGVTFTGHPAPGPLLLPGDQPVPPLRKDVALTARSDRPADTSRGRR